MYKAKHKNIFSRKKKKINEIALKKKKIVTILIKNIITKLAAAVIQDVYDPSLIQSLGASNKIVTDTITIKTCTSRGRNVKILFSTSAPYFN